MTMNGAVSGQRSWQLIMTGFGHDHVSAEAQDALVRLLDLRPSLTHLDVETDSGIIHVARDWPSTRMEEADALLTCIGETPGIRAVTLPQGQ